MHHAKKLQIIMLWLMLAAVARAAPDVGIGYDPWPSMTGRKTRLPINSYQGFVPPPHYECHRITGGLPTAKTFLRQFVLKRKPVVIAPDDLGNGTAAGLFARGLGPFDSIGWGTSRWLGKSGDNYLSKKVGDRLNVQVGYLRHNDLEHGYFGPNSPEEDMSFPRFLKQRRTRSDRGLYMNDAGGNAPIIKKLMDDFRLPDFVKDTGISLGMINMWIGGTGRLADETKTMLHMDTEDNVYALVEGTKAFTLYAPAYAQLMYPRGAIRKVSPNGVPAGANNMIENMHHQHFTAVDHPHEPDRSRFSEFPARAAGLFASCTVHAGELLFLPGGPSDFCRTLFQIERTALHSYGPEPHSC